MDAYRYWGFSRWMYRSQTRIECLSEHRPGRIEVPTSDICAILAGRSLPTFGATYSGVSGVLVLGYTSTTLMWPHNLILASY
jgi:hypothetical protein